MNSHNNIKSSEKSELNAQFNKEYLYFRSLFVGEPIYNDFPEASNTDVNGIHNTICKIMVTIFSQPTNYDSRLDSFFSSTQMKEHLMNALLRNTLTHMSISKNITKLLKYCDVNFYTEYEEPFFIFICNYLDMDIIKTYLPSYNFSNIIKKDYNLISYLFYRISSRSCQLRKYFETIKTILEYIKQAKTPEQTKDILSVYPKDWKNIFNPLINVTEAELSSTIFDKRSQFSTDIDLSIATNTLVVQRQRDDDMFSTNGQHKFEIPNKYLEINEILYLLKDVNYEFKIDIDDMINLFNINNLDLFKFFIANKIYDISQSDFFGYSLLLKLCKILLEIGNAPKCEKYINYLLEQPDIDVTQTNILNQSIIMILIKSTSNADISYTKGDRSSVYPMISYNGIDSSDGLADVFPFGNSFLLSSTNPPAKEIIRTTSDVVADILSKLLANPKINPNSPDANGEIPLFVALKNKNIKIINSILTSPTFNFNYRYDDGSYPIIKLAQELLSFTSYDKQHEVYFYVLNTFIKNKNVSLTNCDYFDKNVLMYVAEKDNNIILRKLLECDISSTDINNLLAFTTQKHCVVNINVIKNKITSCVKKGWF